MSSVTYLVLCPTFAREISKGRKHLLKEDKISLVVVEAVSQEEVSVLLMVAQLKLKRYGVLGLVGLCIYLTTCSRHLLYQVSS
jgi:hypothetical protein